MVYTIPLAPNTPWKEQKIKTNSSRQKSFPGLDKPATDELLRVLV
jgi:hypothetical protein